MGAWSTEVRIWRGRDILFPWSERCDKVLDPWNEDIALWCDEA